jgi:hypothetical protein
MPDSTLSTQQITCSAVASTARWYDPIATQIDMINIECFKKLLLEELRLQDACLAEIIIAMVKTGPACLMPRTIWTRVLVH